ncbi:hypothetical protein ACIRU8_19160 [Streptomyces sp. NPDC101175]|uniref:hypothetical protein n=1 Tax=Streptomyces sp. NPDC101175 TaxID=3366123 RepID=UPI0038352A34
MALKPAFPRTVAIVAPAIVVVNVLHFAANELWTRRQPPPVDPDRDKDGRRDGRSTAPGRHPAPVDLLVPGQ